MQKALNHLRKIEPERTYVVSLQTMVFARAEPDETASLIDRNVQVAGKHADHRGAVQRGWTYPGIGADGDNSNSPVRPAGPARGRARRRVGQRPHLAAGQDVLGEMPERRRLLGLQQAERPTAPAA